MPSYNAAAYIRAALDSVLAQTLRDIEIIVVDDASTDATPAIAAAIAGRDPRVKLFHTAVNGGPAVARNAGLDQARGRWIAVVDSDDLIHPDRLQRLVHLAEAACCDIAADDMLVFDDAGAAAPYAFLNGAQPAAVDLASYVLANAYGRAGPMLGFLKPLFRTAFLRQSGVRYRPELRIAQDFSFVRSLLAAGAAFRIFPGMTYFFRRRAGSNSHRLGRAHIVAMIEDDERFLAAQPTVPAALAQASDARRLGFQRALAFDGFVQSIKGGRWGRAAAILATHPGMAPMLASPIAARLHRARRPPATTSRQQVCIVTFRQTGLQAVTDLAASIAAPGRDVHLVIPNPVRRGAIIRLPGMAVFQTIATRRGPAEEPWGSAQQLFLARHARACADILVIDAPPGIDAAPYALRPCCLVLALDAAASAIGPAPSSPAPPTRTRTRRRPKRGPRQNGS